MNRMLLDLQVVRTAFCMHLKQMAVDGFVIFLIVFQPLFIALLAIYMLRDSEGFQAIFVVVGSAMTGLWSGTLFFSSHNVEGERFFGTLESVIASPSNLFTVMLGKSLANVTLSVGSMVFSYPLAALVFGYQLTIAHPLSFVVSMLLTVLALVSLGMLIAPLMAINPGSNMWTNLFEFPVYIAGGFLFPIALLPGWITPISYVLAPYWAALALHDTASGSVPLENVFLSWFFMIVLTVIYWFISTWLFRIVLWRAREEATLGLQ